MMITIAPKQSSEQKKYPPLARGLPLLGSALDLAKDPNQFLVKAYKKYGPAFRVRIPTAPRGEAIFLAGVQANLFASQEGARYFTTKEYYRHLVRETGTPYYLAALDGEPHSMMRRQLKPGFTREALRPYIPQLVEIVRQSARSWAVGQRIPVTKTFLRLTIDQLALAASNSPMSDDLYAHLEKYAWTFVGAGVAMMPPILFQNPLYRRGKQVFEAFLKRAVEHHRGSGPGPQRNPDLVDMILRVTYPGGQPLGEADLIANAHLPYVNGLIYAGRVCAYLLYALLKNPGWLDRVTLEVDAALAQGSLDIKTLRRMSLLRSALMETYRLYPIAPSVPRYAFRDFEFAGYHIPAGSTVFIAMTVPHFLDELYPDPYTFDPGRFAPDRSEHSIPGAFAPYGLGTHVCISAGLVETVAMITMASLLHTVRLSLDPPGYTLKTAVDPVPGPEGRFRVRVAEQRPEVIEAADPDAILGEQIADILPGVSTVQAADLASSVQVKTYSPGEIIIREGDPADALYMINEGEVEVVKAREGGDPQVVARLGSGQFFGEIGLLHGIPRTATVRAASPIQAMTLDRDTFTALVAESDLTSAEISQLIQRRRISTGLAVALPRLTLDQVGQVAPQFELLRFEPGAAIIRQGDLPDRFYIVASGAVEVINQHPGGREVVIAQLGPGEYFGEIGLLHNRPRTATVRAVGGPAEVMALDRDAFRQMVAGSAETGSEIGQVIAERLLDLFEKTSPIS